MTSYIIGKILGHIISSIKYPLVYYFLNVRKFVNKWGKVVTRLPKETDSFLISFLGHRYVSITSHCEKKNSWLQTHVTQVNLM